jgi:hypothetical protein
MVISTLQSQSPEFKTSVLPPHKKNFYQYVFIFLTMLLFYLKNFLKVIKIIKQHGKGYIFFMVLGFALKVQIC